MRSQLARHSLAALTAYAGLAITCARAAEPAPPPPTQTTATDASMAIVNKRQSGSFTVRWQPAHDAAGREFRAYDLLVANCSEVRSASGSPLPPAAGGRLRALTGPPYAVALSGCNCNAAVAVHTAALTPASQRSAPAAVARGTIFGPPCR